MCSGPKGSLDRGTLTRLCSARGVPTATAEGTAPLPRPRRRCLDSSCLWIPRRRCRAPATFPTVGWDWTRRPDVSGSICFYFCETNRNNERVAGKYAINATILSYETRVENFSLDAHVTLGGYTVACGARLYLFPTFYCRVVVAESHNVYRPATVQTSSGGTYPLITKRARNTTV